MTLPLARSIDDLKVTVYPTDKVKCRVVAERTRVGVTDILAVDELNPILRKERQAFSQLISDPDDRDSIAGLLMEIADEIVTLRANEPKPKLEKNGATFVDLTESWPEWIDGAKLLDSVSAVITSYVMLPQSATVALSLWVVHTYLLDVADYSPRIHVSSPARECGKTVLLEILSELAYQARLTSGVTAAALYRLIDAHHPTMLIDELDARLKSDGAEIFRGVLNSSFQRVGRFTICVGEHHEPKDFSTFCAMVLAGIGRLWDTVTSRSIPVRLSRASKIELKALKRIKGHTISGDLKPYRQQLQRWADDNREDLRKADPGVPMELGARQADVWRPLLAIADAAGADWAARARKAAVDLHSVPDEEGDNGLLLLSDLRDLIGADVELSSHIFSATVVEELSKLENRPWPEYRGGQPISTRSVATLLKRFNIEPEVVRIGAEIKRGYKIEALAPAFKRYLPELVTDVTALRGNSSNPIVFEAALLPRVNARRS